jgi:hypothetical protein
LATEVGKTPFYVGKERRRVIEDMKQRDLVRKQTQDRAREEQIAQGEPARTPEPSQEYKKDRGPLGSDRETFGDRTLRRH